MQRQEQATQTELAYFVCFYEIYGGRVLDLLNQRKVLRVRTPSPHPPFPRAPTYPVPAPRFPSPSLPLAGASAQGWHCGTAPN